MIKRDRNIVPILGVEVDSSKRDEVLEQTLALIYPGDFVPNRGMKYIVTPNPEIVTYASSHPPYALILNAANLSLLDGVGLLAAVKFLKMPKAAFGLNIPLYILQALIVGVRLVGNRGWFDDCGQVYPGRIFIEDLIRHKRVLKIFLLGGKSQIAAKASAALIKDYPSLVIEFEEGPWFDRDGEPVSRLDEFLEKKVIKKINKFKPDLLVVSLGFPKQEYWIFKNRDRLKVKVAIGAGGTLDYLAGIYPNPSNFISKLGMEWLWRLFTQTGRLSRILTATIVFPWKVFLWKIKSKIDIYKT